jgi:hypothetical protein
MSAPANPGVWRTGKEEQNYLSGGKEDSSIS